MTASDEELVETIKTVGESDTRAYAELIQRHQERILANCRYMTRSAVDAEDLAQEVFTKAYFALGRFEGRSSFKTWIQRIKINHCLNHLDKKSGRHFVDVEDPTLAQQEELHIEASAERDFKARTDRERIATILDSLSDTLRLPLIMREIDGMAYQEIADHLDVGLSAVKMRIKRAREAFRATWDEQEREP